MHDVPGARRERRRSVDRVVAVIGALLLTGVAGLAPLVAALSGMRVAGCTEPCRYDLLGQGAALMSAGPVVVLVLAGAGVLLARRRRSVWWIPVLGLALDLVVLAIGERLTSIGVGAVVLGRPLAG